MVSSDWRKLEWNGVTSLYYFDSDGTMATGWRKLSSDDDPTLYWYYFKSNGAMASNECLTVKLEKYCFRASGVCYSGNGC